MATPVAAPADVHDDYGGEATEDSGEDGGKGGATPRAPPLKMQLSKQRVVADPRPAVIVGKGPAGEGPHRRESDEGGGTPLDGTRSQAGSSHGSSTTSSAAVLPMLQRSVDVHNRTPEPALRALRSIFLWTLLVAATAAVATLVVNGFMVVTVEKGLDVLRRNGRRQMLATRITADALSLSLASRGLLPNSTEDVAVLRDSLRTAADEFFHLHQDLYDHAVTVGLGQVVAQYTEPTLTFVEEEEDGAETKRRITLLEAGLEFVKRARLVAEAPMAVTRSDPDVAFLLANGESRLQQACNTSSLDSVGQVTAAKMGVVDLYLWQFTAALILVEACLVWFVQPAVREIQHTKEAVFQMFLDVPREALTSLRDRAHRLLSAAMDGEVMVDGDHASEDGDRGAEPQEEATTQPSPAPAITDGQAAASRARRRKRAQPRTMSRSHAEQFATTVRFGGGMFFVLFYFAAAFLVVEHNNETALQVPRNVYYSTQRYAAAHDLYLRALHALAPDAPGRMYNTSLHTVDKVLRFSHILLFGDTASGTLSELSFSQDIKRLQLDDGCAGDPAPADCAAFEVLDAAHPLAPAYHALRGPRQLAPAAHASSHEMVPRGPSPPLPCTRSKDSSAVGLQRRPEITYGQCALCCGSGRTLTKATNLRCALLVGTGCGGGSGEDPFVKPEPHLTRRPLLCPSWIFVQDDRIRVLLTDRMAGVREMDREYLSRGLRRLTTEFVAAAQAQLEATQNVVLVVTVGRGPLPAPCVMVPGFTRQ